MITKNKILQIPVSVKLLIVIVCNRIELSLILSPEHRYAVTTEVAACHGNYMSRRVAYYPSHYISKSGICISTRMMELINGKKTIVEFAVIEVLHSITQRGMSTHKYPGSTVSEELDKPVCLVLLISTSIT